MTCAPASALATLPLGDENGLRIGSMFSGIGGFELGVEAALAEAGIPHRVLWQVEIDDFCRRILAKHWPHTDRRQCDVVRALAGQPRALGPNVEVLRARRSNLVPVDVCIFGFPCQDVSSAGRGAGLEGARSGLWFAGRDVVAALRPWGVIVENVASGRKRWLCRVRADLHALGYRTTAYQIGVHHLGGPHRRERIFVVAVADASCGGTTTAKLERLVHGAVAGGALAHADCAGDARRANDAARHERSGGDARWTPDPGGAADGGPVADAERLGLQRRENVGAGGSDPGWERDAGDLGWSSGVLATSGGGAVADATDGQPHQRQGEVRPPDIGAFAGRGELRPGGCSGDVADADGDTVRLGPEWMPARRTLGVRGPRGGESGDAGAERALADAWGRGRPTGDEAPGRQPEPDGRCALADANGAEAGTWPGAAGPAQGEGRLGAQPEVGGGADGLPAWMDRALPDRWPAGRGEAQHPWEPPRTIAGREPHRRARLRALGNAVSPAQAKWVGWILVREIVALAARIGGAVRIGGS